MVQLDGRRFDQVSMMVGTLSVAVASCLLPFVHHFHRFFLTNFIEVPNSSINKNRELTQTHYIMHFVKTLTFLVSLQNGSCNGI